MQILSDKDTDYEFRRKGYVVLPFLGDEEIKALKQLHDSLTPEVPSDYYTTLFNPDMNYRRHIHEGVKAIVEMPLQDMLPHHQICFGGYVTKRPNGMDGKVPLHQDYAFADNAVDPAVHVWCPLIDVSETNGCMKVVIASHTFLKHISAVPPNPFPFYAVAELLETDYTTKIPMSMGSALVYDQRLLHGSDENRTEHPRIACACALVPKTAPPRIYSWNEEAPTQLDVFEVTDEFFFQFPFTNATAISESHTAGVRYLESIDSTPETVTPERLESLKRIQAELSADGGVGRKRGLGSLLKRFWGRH
jgi:hypothetical protein